MSPSLTLWKRGNRWVIRMRAKARIPRDGRANLPFAEILGSGSCPELPLPRPGYRLAEVVFFWDFFPEFLTRFPICE